MWGTSWNRPIQIMTFSFSKSYRVSFTTRLRSGKLCEPPLADPHEGWFVGWGSRPPGYPITPLISYIVFILFRVSPVNYGNLYPLWVKLKSATDFALQF